MEIKHLALELPTTLNQLQKNTVEASFYPYTMYNTIITNTFNILEKVVQNPETAPL